MVARDFDTALWLHNKLGTSNDQWSGKTIVSQLSRDKLRNIRDCFIDLQPQVKLKLLLAIIHIAKRNVEDWRAELEDILDIAVLDDSGQRWVSTIAELLRYYPRDFQINLNIVENTSVFNDLVTELKNAFDEIDIDCAMLPLECIYLNKNAMTALFGPQPLPEKHFTLIRKPKSAAIRAELLQRSSDALSGKSLTTTPSIPIRMRGVSDTPLRGISAKSPFASVMKANSAAKGSGPIKSQPKLRDGGVKLLEIDQQPSTSRKRKKSFAQDDSQSDANSESPTKLPPTTNSSPTS
uniref:Negative elongation factor A n=1 Tax=Aceria tosichella TaxID=561515 RepID=A0A6G1SMP8_9ACAR